MGRTGYNREAEVISRGSRALNYVPARKLHPDPREDLESRSPNLGPYTTKDTLQEPPLRDLLFGSSPMSAIQQPENMRKNTTGIQLALYT